MCGGLEAPVQPLRGLESFPFLHSLACTSNVWWFCPDLSFFLRLDSFLTLFGPRRFVSRIRSIFTPLRAASAACYRQPWKSLRRHCRVSPRWEHAREHPVKCEVEVVWHRSSKSLQFCLLRSEARPVNRDALRCCVYFLLLPAAQVGAVDCSGKAERFCVKQGVKEFPGVMIAIDGKMTNLDGKLGGSHVAPRRRASFFRERNQKVCRLCFRVLRGPLSFTADEALRSERDLGLFMPLAPFLSTVTRFV